MLELFELRQAVTQLYESCLMEAQTQTGLSRGELDVLLFLANHPEYDTATDVVKIRRLSKSHVSATVEKLVQRGMLARRVEEKNRRVVRLSLQSAAAEAIAQGRKARKTSGRRSSRESLPRSRRSLPGYCVTFAKCRPWGDRAPRHGKIKEKGEGVIVPQKHIRRIGCGAGLAGACWPCCWPMPWRRLSPVPSRRSSARRRWRIPPGWKRKPQT